MGLSFGVWDHFERLAGRDAATQYDERIGLVRRCEELGFSHYFVAEHHLSPLSMAPSPLIYLAALARATSRIRLGSMIVILPFYPPIRLAEEICMLDGLSAGRLEVGVGRGIRDVEHEWFGGEAARAREVFTETLETVRGALCSGKVAVCAPAGGAHTTLVHEPTQRPMPPMWYVANMDYAAEQGMRVLANRPLAPDVARYLETYAARAAEGSALHHHAPDVASTRPIYLMSDGEAARARARSAWETLGDHFWATDTRVAGRPFVRGIQGPGAPFADALANGQVLAGTPDEVGERLETIVRDAGVGHGLLLNSFQWGNLTHDEARASLELFASALMARLTSVHAELDAQR